MPPRHHYWTIILEGKPTAFRAHTEEELVPTLRQLQAKHPDAVMKWFARGRLWDSQEIERADSTAKRRPHAAPAGERRPRDWRPGGEHKDPRDRFKISRDEKRRRFAENLHRDPMPPGDKGDRSGESGRPPKGEEAPRPDGPPRSDRPPRADRPATFDRPPDSDRPQRTERPRQDRPPFGGPPPNRPGGFARGPRTDRPPRFDRPPHTAGGKPPWKRDERAGGREDSRSTVPRKFGRPDGDRRPGPTSKPPAGGRPFSGRPPNRGGAGRPPGGGAGRPPAGGRRFGSGPPRSPGNRKPGGGGKKGGGGGSR